jgi:uncharacterized phage protein (TIGR01671 family)
MRKIKFRAWDNVENEMLYCGENVEVLFVLGSAGIECTDIRNVSPDGHDVFKQHLLYMQYTGLKDKNGKEIYEGDVVKGYWWQKGESHRHIGKVAYSMSAFKVVGVKQYKGMSDELSPVYEVIGNIYENPELLED